MASELQAVPTAHALEQAGATLPPSASKNDPVSQAPSVQLKLAHWRLFSHASSSAPISTSDVGGDWQIPAVQVSEPQSTLAVQAEPVPAKTSASVTQTSPAQTVPPLHVFPARQRPPDSP